MLQFQESHQNWINWDFVSFHWLVVVCSFQNNQCQAFPPLNNLPWKSSLTCRIAYMTYMSVQPTYITPQLNSSSSSRISDQNANNTCLVTKPALTSKAQYTGCLKNRILFSLSLSAGKISNTHIYGSYSVNPTQNSTQKKSMKALHTFLQRVLINLAVSL